MQKRDKVKSSSRKNTRPVSKIVNSSLANKKPVPAPATHHTYVLRCADSTLYVGATNNLERRLVQHNTSKQGAHYTKIRRPVSLAYFETFATLGESRKREAALKRMSRAEKLTLVEKHGQGAAPRANSKTDNKTPTK